MSRAYLYLIAALVAISFATAANPGHGASAVSAGTFESGNYVFPAQLDVTGNLVVNTSRFFVTASSGNVGIATAVPNYTLHVVGTANITGALALSTSLAYTSGGTGLAIAPDDSVLVGSGTAWVNRSIPSCSGSREFLKYATATNVFSCASEVGYGGTGTDNYIAKFASSGADLANTLIYDNGTAIGIGTNALLEGPGLTINGSLGGYGIYINSSTGAGVYLRRGGTGSSQIISFETAGSGRDWTIGNDAESNENLYIYRYTSTKVVTIDSNLNVGIGVAPTAKLTVNGSINITNSSTDAQICFNNDCRTSWPAAGSGGGNITGSGSANYVGRWTNGTDLGTGVLQDNGTSVITSGNIVSSGGNARGYNAIDLQLTRTENAQVASGRYAIILGGANNTVANNFSIIVGGFNNNITHTAHQFGEDSYNFIGGGSDNRMIGSGYTQWNVIAGGDGNLIRDGYYNGIVGGQSNSIDLSGSEGWSSIVGGYNNKIDGDTYYSVITGGSSNVIGSLGGDGDSFIGAGSFNHIIGDSSAIVAGYRNNITDQFIYNSFIGGGIDNNITDPNNYFPLGSAIVVGNSNVIEGGEYSIIGGGEYNTIRGNNSFIGAGMGNTINASLAAIPVGLGLQVEGYGQVVMGRYNIIQGTSRSAWTDGDQAFIIGNGTGASSRATSFSVTNNGNVYIGGNVGIGVQNPGNKLSVNGSINASGNISSFSGLDLAEAFSANEPVEPGDLVAMVDANTVKKASDLDSYLTIGVVSGNPGFILNKQGLQNPVLIGIAGRVPVKVAGVVLQGDFITPSPTPGYGQAATAPGYVLGRALEDANNGFVMMIIQPTYFSPQLDANNRLIGAGISNKVFTAGVREGAPAINQTGQVRTPGGPVQTNSITPESGKDVVVVIG